MSALTNTHPLTHSRFEDISTDSNLSTLSPKDDKWDNLKMQSQIVARMFERIGYQRYAERIGNCSSFLTFTQVLNETGTVKFKLSDARFCKVRLCPICQWRRSLMWMSRFFKALPSIRQDYPNTEFIFLTLTARNVPVEELRLTLVWMNRSWQRMIQRKAWPGIGFARSVELTRSATGEAHPHFHVLLMVPRYYFKSKSYLSKQKWIQLWRASLQVDYDPSIWVEKVKAKKKGDPVQQAILETFKYAVKYSDLAVNDEWLMQISKQLDNTKAVSIGGCFKNYMTEDEPDDLVGSDEHDDLSLQSITFGWRERLKKYSL